MNPTIMNRAQYLNIVILYSDVLAADIQNDIWPTTKRGELTEEYAVTLYFIV
jgi:hypothetical protein